MRTGRKSSYNAKYAEQAKKLCQLGATDMEIAEFFGVDVRTIHRWKNQFPEFCHALKAGKEESDNRVERSLYQKAIGYSFESEKIFQYQGEVVRAKTVEHVPPDTIAAIFWLKNRRKDEWRDVHRVEHGEPGEFDRLNDEQLMVELREDAARLGIELPDAGETTH